MKKSGLVCGSVHKLSTFGRLVHGKLADTSQEVDVMRLSKSTLAIFGAITTFNCQSPIYAEVLLAHSKVSAQQLSIGEGFKKGWDLATKASSGTHCGRLKENSVFWSTRAAKSFLNTRDLSPQCSITFRLKGSHDEFPAYEVISEEGSPSDLFYCEQAIWESSPERLMAGSQEGNLVCDSKQFKQEEKLAKIDYFHKKISSAELYKSKNAETGNAIVVMHVIPRSFNTDQNVLFTREELASPNNLIAIPTANIEKKELLSYRKEWADYVSKNETTRRTKTEVLTFAANLLNKYSELFKESERGE